MVLKKEAQHSEHNDPHISSRAVRIGNNSGRLENKSQRILLHFQGSKINIYPTIINVKKLLLVKRLVILIQ